MRPDVVGRRIGFMIDTPTRIAIVGSRNFPLLFMVRAYVWGLHFNRPETIVVSGGAAGVDTAAVEEAQRLKMTTEVYPADWKTYGRGAGFKRNADIIRNADEVVAFWDEISKGTKHTIDLAKAAGKPVTVFTPTLGTEREP